MDSPEEGGRIYSPEEEEEEEEEGIENEKMEIMKGDDFIGKEEDDENEIGKEDGKGRKEKEKEESNSVKEYESNEDEEEEDERMRTKKKKKEEDSDQVSVIDDEQSEEERKKRKKKKKKKKKKQKDEKDKDVDMKVETSSKAEEDEERESEDEDDELLLKKRKRGERKDSSDLKADEADEKSEEEKNLSYAELKRKAAARARQEKRELEKKIRAQSATCAACGLNILDTTVGTNMYRWSAACRWCRQNNFSKDEHKAYLEQLTSRTSEKGRGKERSNDSSDAKDVGKPKKKKKPTTDKDKWRFIKCPYENCEGSRLRTKKGLKVHLKDVHFERDEAVLSEFLASAEYVYLEPKIRGPQIRKRRADDSPDSVKPRSSGATASSRVVKKVLKRSWNDVVESLYPLRSVHEEMFDGSAKSRRKSGGFIKAREDNLISWDDSLRTRHGLLPLEPPQSSRAFSSPFRMSRVMIANGVVSVEWNKYFALCSSKAVVGCSPEYSKYLDAETALENSRKRKRDAAAKAGDKSNERKSAKTPDDETVEQLEAAVAVAKSEMTSFQKRRPPRRCFSKRLGQPIFQVTGDKSGPLFSFDEVLKRDTTNFKYTSPKGTPAPPSDSALEESAWIEEASRLVRRYELERDRKNKDDGDVDDGQQDVFVQFGLKPINEQTRDRSERKAPSLVKLQDAMSLGYLESLRKEPCKLVDLVNVETNQEMNKTNKM